jgi:hypothetical protein
MWYIQRHVQIGNRAEIKLDCNEVTTDLIYNKSNEKFKGSLMTSQGQIREQAWLELHPPASGVGWHK